MWELNTESISLKSSNGVDTLSGVIWSVPQVKPRALIQISHGMCEYIQRYRPLAEYLAQRGFILFGNDHLGHGETSGQDKPNGYFGKDGRVYVLKDLYRVNQMVRARYPGLPVILLGHSMGSFFARWFAVQYPDALDALILSGTAGPNPALPFAIWLSRMMARYKGEGHTAKLLNVMAFGAYLEKIKHPKTCFDWISRDEQVVQQYMQDEKCTFIFTANGFHELFCTLRRVSKPQWAAQVRKDLPIWLFAGDADPVGGYGKGVKQVVQMLRKAGVKQVELTLYPGGRHEMLNETNREQVYQDMERWLDGQLKQKEQTS